MKQFEPDHPALGGQPVSGGLGVLDMSRCALFVYVGHDGQATADASGVSKTEAAAILRHIAELWDKENTNV